MPLNCVFLLDQTCATTRPVFIAKLKLNRIFAWLYKTFLFGSIFGITFFFLLYFFAGGLVPSGCFATLCVALVYAIYAPMYTPHVSLNLWIQYSLMSVGLAVVVVVVAVVRSNCIQMEIHVRGGTESAKTRNILSNNLSRKKK